MEEIPPFFAVYTRVALCRFLNTDFFGQRIIPVGRTSRSGCAAVIWHHLDSDAVIDMR